MQITSVKIAKFRHITISLSVLLIITLLGIASPSNAINSQDIELAFAGDIHFEEQLRTQSAPGGLQPFRPILGGADISIIKIYNLFRSCCMD